MESIKSECPNCMARVEIPEDLLGVAVACEACGHEFKVGFEEKVEPGMVPIVKAGYSRKLAKKWGYIFFFSMLSIMPLMFFADLLGVGLALLLSLLSGISYRSFKRREFVCSQCRSDIDPKASICPHCRTQRARAIDPAMVNPDHEAFAHPAFSSLVKFTYIFALLVCSLFYFWGKSAAEQTKRLDEQSRAFDREMSGIREEFRKLRELR